MYRVILLGFIIGVLGCSERDRLNPLDTENPWTEGKPTSLTVFSEKQDVTLSWDPVDLYDVSEYYIYRRMQDEEFFDAIGCVGSDLARFVDRGLPYDMEVSYRISVTVSNYESPLSDSVSITPGPNSYWVVDYYLSSLSRLTYDVVHTIFRDFYDMWPVDVAVDTVSRTAWVLFRYGYLLKISFSGEELLLLEGLNDPTQLALDAAGGVVWVCVGSGTQVVLYDSIGNELGLIAGFGQISDLCVVGSSGACWIADKGENEILLFSPSQVEELSIKESVQSPVSIAYDGETERLWVADSLSLIQIKTDGQVEQIAELDYPILSISANSTTGDCWAILESENLIANEVVRVSGNGEVIARSAGFCFARSLVANPHNGECLVADTGNSRVVRLSPYGQVMSENWNFVEPRAIVMD
jgi:DNA-binding beta-propeller fold protein YncE